MRLMRVVVGVAVAVLLTVSCIAPKGSTLNPVLGPGETPTPLQQPAYVGIGKYVKLFEGPLAVVPGGVSFVSFVRVRQPANVSMPSFGSDGLAYAVKSVHVVASEDGDQQAIAEGSAGVVAFDATHPATPVDQDWFFISLGGIAKRGQPLPAHASLVYATPDLSTLPPGTSVVQQVGLITMAAGGRTSSHTHGGTEAFYVAAGSVELRLGDGTRKTIAAGQGGAVRAGLPMQMVVVGNEPVTILTYFATPSDQPWQTNLQTVP